MDLIASTRAGLVEQLGEEAAALAGSPRDLVQRAIAYHHLYDCSGGRHGYALLAGAGAVGLNPAVAAMKAAARRARWRIGREASEALVGRCDAFGAALAAIDRDRCQEMVVAYRLMHTPGLRDEALARLPAALVAAHAGDEAHGLFAAHLGWFEERWGAEVDAATTALAWPLKHKAAAVVTALLRVGQPAYDRAARKGWPHVEKTLLSDPAMPAGAARNPAQHYYAMQRMVCERRRQAQASLGLSPEETVVLAA
ncbi:hypothetical protein ABDK56_03625 [Sphingomonas sp. ASV193]|uniref:hypothetical protein n=1 Tax=Sphingomonas sp. ASV193 TaxID=3144405 RepID=UPI0032E89131